MEKSETMKERYENETGKEALVFSPKGMSPSNGYVEWLVEKVEEMRAKAESYDRLVSGGRKTLKEWANIFGAYFAVGKSGVGYVFRDNPPLVENTFMGQCFAIVYPEFIDFSGDWKDSLTLPDGWEEK